MQIFEGTRLFIFTLSFHSEWESFYFSQWISICKIWEKWKKNGNEWQKKNHFKVNTNGMETKPRQTSPSSNKCTKSISFGTRPIESLYMTGEKNKQQPVFSSKINVNENEIKKNWLNSVRQKHWGKGAQKPIEISEKPHTQFWGWKKNHRYGEKESIVETNVEGIERVKALLMTTTITTKTMII